MATPPLLPMPGMRLGKYELLERLAVGGMAEIFIARSVGIEGFEKLVVCKCILSQRAADDDFIRMFVDEARLAAQLHHPNVAHVFDIGREGDLHFFAMEYIHGADVGEVQQAARAKGTLPVPLEQALTIAIGAAAGLHYAHEKTDSQGHPLQIVHRDVSPSNVVVSFDGAVKVVDFGIAKAATQWARTRTGSVKGKLSCMSPEQCRGETVDRRSDVFAVGILLYELTTGVRPFQGDSDYAIIRRIVDEDAAPPSTLVPDYPPALEAIVLRALRRDPAQRYATAQELQIDLETFAHDQDLVLSPVELSRYMHELFGDRRPVRAVAEPERFLHGKLGAERTTRVEALGRTREQPASRARRAARSVAWSVAGIAIAAVLIGGTYFLRDHNEAPSPAPEARQATRPDSALTTSLGAAGRAADLPVPAGADVADPPVAPVARRAVAVPGTRSVAVATPARRRKPPRQRPATATPSSKARPAERDLDAPFPR